MAVSSLGASDSWGDPRSVTGFATFAPVPTLTLSASSSYPLAGEDVGAG